ncbi:TPA: GIY-YIG nuclease family protein [Legionella pneumophila]|uniref:GIY-YIG nuclease family protein n=2 Tax=Gammaproteobacteria TaxID=1236 RepID=A0AAN5P6J9_LEGPN|nr:GIY-YIG nuclease family protein [Legionella pneumophila]MDW9167239.1 GIY-YIG nuclease family protein [Legionella pneumophila subsp. fraseri]AMV15258.1 T5orf172 domain protein [Legionella pneumophila]MCH9145101.1 GIY-YIG nuclease family protein [Legionella pneumophila serogroup 1]MCH9157202.1 GIY-YIG nuclease family protein [Legionella pneumophila serogroup 1]MCZ4739375.1 GIY-YIG nuclease family protein [Legionella pneumophila]
MDKVDLLKLIEDDNLGLLKIHPKKSSMLTADERLVESFHEINKFISVYGREPEPGKDFYEHKLHARLKGIRENDEKISALTDLDEYGLLQKKNKEIKSIQDIFENDELGIFTGEDEGIFDVKYVPKETTMPDYVASRKLCNDFKKYENKFIQCQSEISNGKRELYPFNKEQQIKKGTFFILKGVLLYIDSVGDREIIGGRRNARLRCIFENGTESDMLLRSLSAELYKNGRRVTEPDEKSFNTTQLTSQDERKGYIYVLKSLSADPKINSILELFKIGYSKISIEDRIKNAIVEPTYLMAPVSIVTVFECYNMNPQRLEQLLHRFFGSACLNIDIYDDKGRRHVPREWFIAPLEIIEQAIHFVISGDIIHYKYDQNKQIIVNR